MQLNRGQRLKLADLVSSMTFEVGIDVQGIAVDVSCFGVDAAGRLSDDRYMTFFNQPRTPCGSVRLANPAGFASGFQLALDRLPASIERLVFVAVLDGPGTMRQLTGGRFSLIAGEREVAVFPFQGADFAEERALMLAEIYRKDGDWRLSATGQGFNGGLDALVRHFGGEVAAASEAPAAVPEPARLSLDKRVEQEAPHLVSLVKTARLSLDKQGLGGLRARVGLVLDASGSMRNQYKSGRVQELLDRVLPLALHVDDDGRLEVWAFDTAPKPLDPASLANIRDYIDSVQGGWKKWYGGANDEPRAIRLVIDHYRQDPQAPPAYVLFVSDGGVHRNREIAQLMREAAQYPIFWQFMGLGGKNYGILEQLDTMSGRLVDNCGFFAIDDLRDLTDAQLYDRLLQEFPDWLRAARAAGIVS